jgi:hypothetical protein
LAQQALVFLMGLLLLPYPRPFFLQLHLHIAKQVVSSHAHYIFKIVHTNSQIIFIYSMVQRKRKYHSLRMHHFNIPNFPNAIQILNDFNQCANVHGHIHTQCTLALISSFPHFMTSTFHGVLELNQPLHHMAYSFSFIITTGIVLPATN